MVLTARKLDSFKFYILMQLFEPNMKKKKKKKKNKKNEEEEQKKKKTFYLQSRTSSES